MAANGPDSPQNGAGAGGRGTHLLLGRALIVLVIAVVLGVLLLQVGSRAPVSPSSSVGTTTTVASGHGTTTTTAAIVRSSVSVLVANGSKTNGIAAHFTQQLQAQGWATQTPTNALSQASTSSVYYAAGMQGAAELIAQSLGLHSTAVSPISSATPVPTTSGIDIVVIIGTDLAGTPAA